MGGVWQKGNSMTNQIILVQFRLLPQADYVRTLASEEISDLRFRLLPQADYVRTLSDT